ncbi:MAG: tripartite tricarboxylate transporter substrate binding protein, partial [Burkholderiales bacterium]
APGRAQTGGWPQRPVRLVVPYAAGGGPDLQTRKLAPELARALGGNVIVENKVGAGGIVAGEVVAASPPDGYAVLLGSSTHLINKAMQPAVKYDPLRSFDAVTQTSSGGTVLVVPADAPWRSAKELAAAVKARPSAFNYGSGGVGTAAHLVGGIFCRLLDLDAVHVPFRGSVDIVPGLLGAQVQFAFPISSTAMPAIAQGKVRPLAVSAAQRIRPLPDVPTLKELFGSDLMVQESWSGFWLPAGSPREAIEKLFAAARASHETAVVREFYESSGTEVALSASPAAFTEFMRAEMDKWARIVRLVGATPS